MQAHLYCLCNIVLMSQVQCFTDKTQEEFGRTFDAESGGVDTDVVGSAVPPVRFGVEVVVFAAHFVDPLDEFLRLLVGALMTTHQLCDTVFVVSPYKDVEVAWMFSQDVVGASSDDDATFLRSFLPDDVSLHLEEGFFRHRIVVEAVERSEGGGKSTQDVRHEAFTRYFVCLFKHFGSESAFLGSHHDETAVIDRNSEFFGHHFADGLSAAAKFAADGNHIIFHNQLLLRLVWLNANGRTGDASCPIEVPEHNGCGDDTDQVADGNAEPHAIRSPNLGEDEEEGDEEEQLATHAE